MLSSHSHTLITDVFHSGHGVIKPIRRTDFIPMNNANDRAKIFVFMWPKRACRLPNCSKSQHIEQPAFQTRGAAPDTGASPDQYQSTKTKPMLGMIFAKDPATGTYAARRSPIRKSITTKKQAVTVSGEAHIAKADITTGARQSKGRKGPKQDNIFEHAQPIVIDPTSDVDAQPAPLDPSSHTLIGSVSESDAAEAEFHSRMREQELKREMCQIELNKLEIEREFRENKKSKRDSAAIS